MIVTGTEAEALHVEQNLVKRHRPPFNIRLRDDKSFPYIAVTLEDEYPRVMFTRERHRRGVAYFGPYANAKKVRETLDVLNRVFQYRPCEGPKPGRHSGIPCLDFHIERCKAPCVGYISKEEYGELIERVMEFLSGETRPILRDLERRMAEAAADERFEDAARYRNRLFAIRHLAERQAADRRSVGTVDVLGIAIEGNRAAVQIFPLRDGRLVDRYGFHLENVEGQDVGAVLEAFALEYYGSAPSIPPQLVVPPAAGDTTALEEFLSDRRGSRVEVRTPARGEKRRLQDLADQNAQLALESDLIQSEQRRLRRVEALEELRECLNLESLPIRIECYDISNIQAESPVGSMVVFQDAVPKKAHYRKFGVHALDGPDDFAAIAEVVSRRFARLGDVTGDEYDESFAAAPNLVVIDGGKGQLSAALAAMQSYDLPRVAVISLAKKEELVFVPGRSAPIVLRPRLGRAAAPAADPRRGTPLRARLPPAAPRDAGARLDLRRPAGDRPGAPPGAAAALRLGRAAARGNRGGDRRACRASRRRPLGRSTRSSTGQAGHEEVTTRSVTLCHLRPNPRIGGGCRGDSNTVLLAGCSRCRLWRRQGRATTVETVTAADRRPRPGIPGKDAIDAFVAAAQRPATLDAMWGMLSSRAEAARRADARRVQERRRRRARGCARPASATTR